MGSVIFLFMAYVPFQHYRYMREHTKRFRVVDAEKGVYRSGCLSADGFRYHIAKYKIKTVVTLWDEDPDPNLANDRFSFRTIKESELCKELGVKYQFIYVRLAKHNESHSNPPQAVKEFLEVMDNEDSFPVLFHCKAGLHRTGVMGAVYRMEYNDWSREDAMRELRSHGFGEFVGNFKNHYIQQYVVSYQPRHSTGERTPVKATLTSRPK